MVWSDVTVAQSERPLSEPDVNEMNVFEQVVSVYVERGVEVLF